MSRIQIMLMTVLAASCATSPYSGQQISTGTISFGGFVDEPGVTVRIDARDKQTGTWPAVWWATSATTPTFAAGAICPNSPALYSYSASVPLQWSIYWTAVTGGFEARVRARKLGVGEQDLLFTSNPNGVSCMQANAFTPDCDFYSVAYTTCGYSLYEATVKTTSSHPWL